MDSRLRGNDGKRLDIAARPGTWGSSTWRGNDGRRLDIVAGALPEGDADDARE